MLLPLQGRRWWSSNQTKVSPDPLCVRFFYIQVRVCVYLCHTQVSFLVSFLPRSWKNNPLLCYARGLLRLSRNIFLSFSRFKVSFESFFRLWVWRSMGGEALFQAAGPFVSFTTLNLPIDNYVSSVQAHRCLAVRFYWSTQQWYSQDVANFISSQREEDQDNTKYIIKSIDFVMKHFLNYSVYCTSLYTSTWRDEHYLIASISCTYPMLINKLD